MKYILLIGIIISSTLAMACEDKCKSEGVAIAKKIVKTHRDVKNFKLDYKPNQHEEQADGTVYFNFVGEGLYKPYGGTQEQFDLTIILEKNCKLKEVFLNPISRE